MKTHYFTCPYCWKEISMLVDPSLPDQSYVEDCENCCNPIAISVKIRENEIMNFTAQKLGQ